MQLTQVEIVGLNKDRRVSYNLKENKDCIKLARLGFSAMVIQRYTGLSLGQIQYRIHRYQQNGFRITDYRNGIGPKATTILSSYTVIQSAPKLMRSRNVKLADYLNKTHQRSTRLRAAVG